MNHLSCRIEEDAKFEENTPLRRAFREHLNKVVVALREIELADSDDTAPGNDDEVAAIVAVVGWKDAGTLERVRRRLDELGRETYVPVLGSEYKAHHAAIKFVREALDGSPPKSPSPSPSPKVRCERCDWTGDLSDVLRMGKSHGPCLKCGSGVRMGLDPKEFEAALVEIGVRVDGPWMDGVLANSLPKFNLGMAVSFGLSAEQKAVYDPSNPDLSGRCYHRTVSVTLGDEANAPVGNSGFATLLERGTHPLLGPWVKTSCEIDSSD